MMNYIKLLLKKCEKKLIKKYLLGSDLSKSFTQNSYENIIPFEDPYDKDYILIAYKKEKEYDELV